MEKLGKEKFAKMMQEKGIEMSPEQAAVVLEFLRRLANIVVAQYLEKHKPE